MVIAQTHVFYNSHPETACMTQSIHVFHCCQIATSSTPCGPEKAQTSMGWCWCFRQKEVDPPYMDAALSLELDSMLSSIAKAETVGNRLLVNVSFRDKQKVSFRKLEPISDADMVHLDWTESRQLLEEAIEVNSKDPLSGGELLPDDDLRLAERLRGLGLEVDVQAGDGNCQFRSLAKQIFGTPEKHGLVRSKAVRYCRLNRQRFLPYLGPEFVRYVESMSMEGCWGDELTLRAASEAFHCMISVITSNKQHWFVRYIPDGAIRGEVFLAYVSPVHYNAIRRINNHSTLK